MTKKSTPTAPIPVHVVLVLDESGSMQGLASDLIGGVNKFFADQRAEEGKCRLTLVKFAPYTVVHDAVDINKVPDLTSKTYRPSSMTPLLDAEGRAITDAMAREAARAKSGKTKEAVLFVTYTDGHENTSHEYTFETLAKLKEQQTEAGWAFLYLGVGHDAYGQSRSMGTSTANTRSRSATSKGMATVFGDISNVTRSYRGAALAGDNATLCAASVDAYGALGVDAPIDDTIVTSGSTTTAVKTPAVTGRGPRTRTRR